MKQVFVVYKSPGGRGGRDTSNCQMPGHAPPGLIVHQMPEVCPGGGVFKKNILRHGGYLGKI